jgi:hypothetical protein
MMISEHPLVRPPVSYSRMACGYGGGMLIAFCCYAAWIVFSDHATSFAVSWLFILGLTLFMAIVGTSFLPALILMAPVWVIVVICRPSGRRQRSVYFVAASVMLTFFFGCTAQALSWKPLFIEDQSFEQSFMIAAQRQWPGLLLAGLALGFTYWVITDRCRLCVKPMPSTAAASRSPNSGS